MICLQPWDYWTLEGEPVGRTPEFAIAESAIHPDHPRQPSVHPHHGIFPPEMAVSGRRPTRIFDQQCGHLVHMASHIWMQTGHDAAECNRKAAALDSAWFEGDPLAGEYRIYQPEPTLFWLACYQVLLERSVPFGGSKKKPPPLSSKPWLEQCGVLSSKWHVLVRLDFGKRFSRNPCPPSGLPSAAACITMHGEWPLPTPVKLIVPAKKWKLLPSPRRHLKKVIHGGWGTNKPMRSCHSPNWCWKAKWNLRMATPRLA